MLWDPAGSLLLRLTVLLPTAFPTAPTFIVSSGFRESCKISRTRVFTQGMEWTDGGSVTSAEHASEPWLLRDEVMQREVGQPEAVVDRGAARPVLAACPSEPERPLGVALKAGWPAQRPARRGSAGLTRVWSQRIQFTHRCWPYRWLHTYFSMCPKAFQREAKCPPC